MGLVVSTNLVKPFNLERLNDSMKIEKIFPFIFYLCKELVFK